MNRRQTQKTVCPAAYFESHWNTLTEILLSYSLWRTRDSRCVCCLLLNEPFRKRADKFLHLLFQLISFHSWTFCLLSPENAFIFILLPCSTIWCWLVVLTDAGKEEKSPENLAKSAFNVSRAVRGAEFGFGYGNMGAHVFVLHVELSVVLKDRSRYWALIGCRVFKMTGCPWCWIKRRWANAKLRAGNRSNVFLSYWHLKCCKTTINHLKQCEYRSKHTCLELTSFLFICNNDCIELYEHPFHC